MVNHDHPVLSVPPPDCKLWRYMDLSKFLWMLEHRSLYFCRADKFEDTHEATYPNRCVEMLRTAILATAPDAKMENVMALLEAMRATMFVSCWCALDHESAAMWGLYMKTAEGIAITTDHKTLCQALQESEHEIYTSFVNYIDYEHEGFDAGNCLNTAIHKRLSFQHEAEVRALIWQPHDGSDGEDLRIPDIASTIVQIDPNQLIQQIHIAPHASEMFADLVMRLAKRYGLDAPVVRSRLYQR